MREESLPEGEGTPPEMVASEQSTSIADGGTGSPPLVSCIMPTRNRRPFVSQAIWYFLRQDYPERELVILDDGDDPVQDLMPRDDRIRYVRLPGRMALGAKRNRACELSQGSVIAHWDDDDWQAANRLTLQVRALMDSRAEVTGAGELLHYALMRGEAWLYRRAPGDLPWVAGGTMLYRRSFWSAHTFREIDVGEDNAFVWDVPAGALYPMANSSYYLAVIHGGNTAPKHLDDPHWQRRSMVEVAARIDQDQSFYAALRNGRPVARRRQLSTSSVTLAAHFVIYDGYGSMSEYLALGMTRAGARVNVLALSLDAAGYSPEFCDLVQHSRVDASAPALYSGWIRADMERLRPAHDLFVHTMWESSQLPDGWAAWLNGVRAVFVPTRFVAEVCRASGVTVPIEVIPDGVDPDVYHYEDRPLREEFTTLMVGPVVERKHTLEGIAAWKRAFADDPTARLIIKARFGYRNYAPDDSRISFIDTNETTKGIAHWYRKADVLMALGNEGFGLPLVEGMATGLPVIALDTEGQADLCQDSAGLVLRVGPDHLQTASDGTFGTCGVRSVPDIGQAAARLRWVSDHRAEAAAMGRAGAEWVVRHRNIWAKGPKVLEFMEAAVRPSRPLRRSHTIWVPSWGTECGIAEYAASLAAALPAGVRVSTDMPDAASLRVLQIEHENSLFEESSLVDGVREAKRAGARVVISEHSVGPVPRAWEQDADVLLAMTRHGAERLKARWPHHRVEYMPQGCHTWFPPRKARPGRVIGAFGFLAPHKGFWRLLEALRAVPGSELLLFSYARSTDLAESWRQAAEGLPVRRIPEFLPVDEVARRLAAEADIMVFWYDEVQHASASLAVRVGLATGIPVLASPTSWFADLRGVTYQPADLTNGIERLLDDDALRNALTDAARDYCHENSWTRSAERHLALWRELEAA